MVVGCVSGALAIPRNQPYGKQAKKECSFLKKRTKKLFHLEFDVSDRLRGQWIKVFASFFQKRSAFLLLRGGLQPPCVICVRQL
jgi:hypothetical protein